MSNAAKREINEECGIKIEVGEVVDAFEVFWRADDGRLQYHYVIVDLAAAYVGGELKAASDILDARWVKLSELDRHALHEKTRQVIRKATRL